MELKQEQIEKLRQLNPSYDDLDHAYTPSLGVKIRAILIYAAGGLPLLASPIAFLLVIMSFDAPGSTTNPVAYLPLAIFASYLVVYPVCVHKSWQYLWAGKTTMGWNIAAIPLAYPLALLVFAIWSNSSKQINRDSKR